MTHNTTPTDKVASASLQRASGTKKRKKALFETQIRKEGYYKWLTSGKKSQAKGLSREQYQLLADRLGYIEFGCKFTKNGCAQYKIRCSIHVEHEQPTCCCSGCYYNHGYLKLRRIHKKDLSVYNKLFKDKLGFWTPKGCSLPRSLRSVTCSFYICDRAKSSEAFKSLLHTLGATFVRH